jgi:iron-sulfur cluster assembly protein
MSLTLTDNAVEAVKEIVSSASEVPETSGIRIVADAAENGQASFQLRVAAVPDAGDEVIEDQGARVFLESATAELLDDKALDADVGADERVAFLISDQ